MTLVKQSTKKKSAPKMNTKMISMHSLRLKTNYMRCKLKKVMRMINKLKRKKIKFKKKHKITEKKWKKMLIKPTKKLKR